MIDLITLYASVTVNIFLSLVILSRNKRSSINLSFAWIALSITVWTIVNYLSNNSVEQADIYNRITFFVACSIGLSMMYASSLFPTGRHVMSPKMIKLNFFTTLLIGFGALLTPFLVKSAVNVDGILYLEVGFLFWVYSLYALIFVAISVFNFKRNYTKATQLQRSQIRIIVGGLMTFAVMAILSNLISPLIIDSWEPSRFGPIYTVFFVGALTYAIAKHQLFDPRLLVIRLVSYLLSLLTLGVLVAASIIFVSSKLFDVNITLKESAVYLLIALLIAILSPYIKRIFDVLTARVFYQNKYKERQIRDDVALTIKDYINAHSLIDHSLELICGSMKVKHAYISVLSEPTSSVYSYGTAAAVDRKKIQALSLNIGDTNDVLITDSISASQDLNKKLRAVDIDFVLTIYDGGVINGYLFMGPKSNGAIYYDDDINLLKDIRDSLGLAIANAKKFDQLQSFNKKLQREVKKATHDLEQANQKLRELDEAKDGFMSMTSHQLKPQLTATQGFIDMLEDGVNGKLNPRQQELASLSSTGVKRMVHLVTSLLDMPLKGSKGITINRKMTEPSTLVKDEISRLKKQFQKKNITLQSEIGKNIGLVDLDKLKIAECVSNILRNAISYTPENGEIKALLRSTSNELVFEVHDSGMGVPKADRKKLFTKFYRSEDAVIKRPTGSGIGLFFVRSVIVAHGGSTIYRPKKKGSVFGFKLPV